MMQITKITTYVILFIIILLPTLFVVGVTFFDINKDKVKKLELAIGVLIFLLSSILGLLFYFGILPEPGHWCLAHQIKITPEKVVVVSASAKFILVVWKTNFCFLWMSLSGKSIKNKFWSTGLIFNQYFLNGCWFLPVSLDFFYICTNSILILFLFYNLMTILKSPQSDGERLKTFSDATMWLATHGILRVIFQALVKL